MKTIHISTANGTNARVPLLRPRSLTPSTVKITARSEEVTTRTIHRGHAPVDLDHLSVQALIDGDPEIDFQHIGMVLPDSSRAYCRPDSPTVIEGNFQVMASTFAPDGALAGTAPHVTRRSNINDTVPVKMGKRIPLAQLVQLYVFHGQMALGHEDGIQHEYLLNIARDLERSGQAALLGAGEKGQLPLIFRDGDVPTRAFICGDTDGDRYRLRILLTRQELKMPETRLAAAAAAD